ncbi:FkbM family methyltransferase [Sphingobium sp. B7D2B]|uniref:FkbM family methyltransferase n=1 Tax=Sphingobium sp. B7D2B TaxID=2940583 RepID=UPI002223FAEB|nr:FkbM family methyltransferase [Sphingobium sp. B7D2B]MCW2366817.1 FkbM family methyltransferase [Sphingobium sp. B7D2B]
MIITESYSQFKEDVITASILGASTSPYSKLFVDVGANDGRSWSNSYFFGQLDWPLLLVEPIPQFAQCARDLYAGNSAVIVEEKAISASRGSVDFFLTSEPDRDLLQMGSSLSEGAVPFGLKSVKTVVETCPLTDLYEAHNIPTDYGVLSVDAEGHDLEVLQTAGLDRWRPLLICVEMLGGAMQDKASREIDQYLTGSGYRFAVQSPANCFYLRRD